MKNAFFAYSSYPHNCEDIIEKAIIQINKGGSYNITSWKQLSINGKFIINEIVKAIEGSDLFCADLTGMNDNVLFEIGYAIGRNKPILLIFDDAHIESFRRYRELDFFSTIGYSTYTSTAHIVTSFYNNTSVDALEKLTENVISNDGNIKKPVLYMKNQFDTNNSESIIKIIKGKKLPYVVDDAVEMKIQPLSWYIDRLSETAAVIAEFSNTEKSGYLVQNSKCSLISGLALGLKRKVLMVCEKPYSTPLDFKDLLYTFTTPTECRNQVDSFLAGVKENYFELFKNQEKFKQTKKEISVLQCINFGDCLAENEEDKLPHYYIETISLDSLIQNKYNVVVGRKGSGKTATLYYLEHTLCKDVKNHVCIIKPNSFELEGLLHILSKTPDNFEERNLIESFWKLIIYTKIAESIYEKLKTKAPYALSENEEIFIAFIDNNEEIFFADLYEQAKINLQRIDKEVIAATKDKAIVKVSEIMHGDFLPKVRDQICNVFDKNIYVLMDNLDKAWKKEGNIEYQSNWVLGLLGLASRISKDLYSSKRNKKNNEFHLTIFLRSDIFHYIYKDAREPDKIEYTKLKVEDKETLLHIIEERFVALSNNSFTYDDLWNKYLPHKIDGIDVKTFIYNNIIPRPRDIIFLFNKIKTIAILRGHTTFTEDDVKEALNEYSEWIFYSLLVENGVTIKQMEDFLYGLVGEPSILLRCDIVSKANNAKINVMDEELNDKFINHLVNLSILGRETRHGKFSFNYDIENGRKNMILAEKFGTKRFKIHNALLPFLKCTLNTEITESGGQADS